MEILVLKTNIKTRKKVETLKPIFNNHPVISKWSVDTDDIDNVLRIETSGSLSENDVIDLLKPYGFYCQDLPD